MSVNFKTVVIVDVVSRKGGYRSSEILGFAFVNLVFIDEILSLISFFNVILVGTFVLFGNGVDIYAGSFGCIPEAVCRLFAGCIAVGGPGSVGCNYLTVVGEEIVDESQNRCKFFGFVFNSRLGNAETGILYRSPALGKAEIFVFIDSIILVLVPLGYGSKNGSKVEFKSPFGNNVSIRQPFDSLNVETVGSLRLRIVVNKERSEERRVGKECL